jgi:hypothetical protein
VTVSNCVCASATDRLTAADAQFVTVTGLLMGEGQAATGFAANILEQAEISLREPKPNKKGNKLRLFYVPDQHWR